MTELIAIDNKINDLLLMSEVPRDQLVREMDRNYLASLVKNNPTLAKEDFVNFITKCQLTGADPRMNQIYLIVHNAWNSQKRVSEPKGTTVFSYQFFLQRAQQTGQLESMRVDTIKELYLDFNTGKERASITARCMVKRTGQAETIYHARFWEFAKTDKDGNLSGNWKSAPYLMLEKCAIANALRWAFSETLGNMYIADEMEKVTDKEDKIYAKTTQHRPQQQLQSAPITSPEAPGSTISSEQEALKVDILDFLKAQPDAWFECLGKKREEMLKAATSVSSGEGIIALSKKTELYDDQAKALLAKATRDLRDEMQAIKREVLDV